jgi:hypothetical protein
VLVGLYYLLPLVPAGDDQTAGRAGGAGLAALAAFWGMVTVGRALFVLIGRWLPARMTYRRLPFTPVGAFARA